MDSLLAWIFDTLLITLKRKEPYNLKYFDLKLTDNHLNLFHIIAMNSSLVQFQMVTRNAREIIPESQYTLKDIHTFMNKSISANHPHKTPLLLAYPCTELADAFIKHGADPCALPFLNFYFCLRKNT